VSNADKLEELADRQAIDELLRRYCRAVDRLDVPLGRSVFHADATADYPGVYQGDGRGVVDHICAQHLHLTDCTHQITNVLIQLDGDRAGSEAAFLTASRMERGGKVRQIGTWGRYIDARSRHDGRWGIDKRIAIRDFDDIREVVPLADHHVGRRDRDDPSYAALEPETA
jgi:hypothetical protein